MATAAVTAAAAAPQDLSATALLQLQCQWPRLRTLQFFNETVARNGRGQLVVPGGIGDLQMLPPPCACCSGPCVMAAPQGSVGRWGSGKPGWLEAAVATQRMDNATVQRG